MEENAKAILISGLKKLNINYSEEKIELVKKYLSELLLFNSHFDLVNAKTENVFIINHILDSLAGFHFFSFNNNLETKTVADIGSGAGFPGIPLAIFLPNVHFSLVERSERRAIFLQNVQAQLKLENVKVFCLDAKKLNQNFDIVTLRALTTMNEKLFNTLFRLVKSEGRLILYKGKITKTKDELERLKNELANSKVQSEIKKVCSFFRKGALHCYY
ncbi:MAG: 16S rRNA (guanine(527)-N(7))-methyltransferase RsmG [Treponemataceae bacterium]